MVLTVEAQINHMKQGVCASGLRCSLQKCVTFQNHSSLICFAKTHAKNREKPSYDELPGDQLGELRLEDRNFYFEFEV